MYILNFCYLCLCNYNNLKNVLIKDNDGIVVEKKLKFCLSEIIDLKPEVAKYICSICLTNLNSFYYFKKTCLKNNTTMNNYLRDIICAADLDKQISLQVLDTHVTNLEATNSKILLVKVTPGLPIAKQEDDGVLPTENSHSLLGEKVNIKEESIVKSEIEAEEIISTEYDIVFKEESPDIDKLNAEIDLLIKEENTPKESNQVREPFLNNLNGETENIVQKKSKKVSSSSENETDIECTTCNKKFTCKKQFRRHQRRHVKNLNCKYCDKTFGDNRLLRKHEKIHLGIKNYQCLICSKSFTQNCNLKKHERIHTGSKDFECTICQKKFTQKGHLTLHEKIHKDRKDFECTVCSKKFVQKINLIMHEKQHTDNKDYQCSFCQKRFIRKDYYENHLDKHHQNFKCSICDKNFKLKRNLAKHTETCHIDLMVD